MVIAPPPDSDNSNDSPSEPYWYARVLGIYHAKVFCTHPEMQLGGNEICRIEFLWVRWFGSEPGYRYGFQRAKLGLCLLRTSMHLDFSTPGMLSVLVTSYLHFRVGEQRTYFQSRKLMHVALEMVKLNWRMMIGQTII